MSEPRGVGEMQTAGQPKVAEAPKAQTLAPYRATEGTPVVPPSPSTIDLHAHTNRSDGVLPPEQLIADAFAAGIRLFAIADHDTLAGYREIVAAGGVPAGMQLIPAVEINSVAPQIPDLRENELHVLGLGVDPDDEAFEALLERQRRLRRERFGRLVEQLREAGIDLRDAIEQLPPEEVRSIGRPHLARLIVEHGAETTVDDAMKTWLVPGKAGYVAREGVGPLEAIHAINAAGGLAVLAHFAAAPEREPLIRELMDAGLRGLEVHYRHFSAETIEALDATATRLGLVPTGGSDYHGDDSSYAEAHAHFWVPPAVGDAVLAALASGQRMAGDGGSR